MVGSVQKLSKQRKIGYAQYYDLLNCIVGAILFSLIYYFFLSNMTLSWVKFGIIFGVNILCGIIGGYIAYGFYKRVGYLSYWDVSNHNLSFYVREIIIDLFYSILIVFCVYELIIKYSHDLWIALMIFCIFKIIIFLIASYVEGLIRK